MGRPGDKQLCPICLRAACRTWGTGNISVWGEVRACTHAGRAVGSPHLTPEVLNLLGSACRRKGCAVLFCEMPVVWLSSHSSCPAELYRRAAPPLQSALSQKHRDMPAVWGSSQGQIFQDLGCLVRSCVLFPISSRVILFNS